jgi:hypothetical protein
MVQDAARGSRLTAGALRRWQETRAAAHLRHRHGRGDGARRDADGCFNIVLRGLREANIARSSTAGRYREASSPSARRSRMRCRGMRRTITTLVHRYLTRLADVGPGGCFAGNVDDGRSSASSRST